MSYFTRIDSKKIGEFQCGCPLWPDKCLDVAFSAELHFQPRLRKQSSKTNLPTVCRGPTALSTSQRNVGKFVLEDRLRKRSSKPESRRMESKCSHNLLHSGPREISFALGQLPGFVTPQTRSQHCLRAKGTLVAYAVFKRISSFLCCNVCAFFSKNPKKS